MKKITINIEFNFKNNELINKSKKEMSKVNIRCNLCYTSIEDEYQMAL